MGGRWVRRCSAGAVGLALASLALTGAGASAAVVAEGKGGGADERQGTVYSRLVFDADRSGELNVLETTRLRLSAAHPMARTLLNDPADREKMEFVKGWFEAGLDLFNEYALDPLSLDSVEVEQGWLLAEQTERLPEDPEAEHIRLGSFLLNWHRGEGVRVGTALIDPTTDDIGWVVVLELDQVSIDRIRPPPSTLSRDGSRITVAWRFPPGTARPPHVNLTLPWAVSLAADESPGWLLLPLLTYLIIAFPLLPALFFLLRRRDLRDALPDSDLLARQLNRLLLAAACLLGSVAGLFVLNELSSGFADLAIFSLRVRVPTAAWPLGLAAGFAAAVFAAGRPPTAWRWIAPVWALVGAAIVLPFLRFEDGDFFTSPSGWEWLLQAVQIPILFVVLFALLDGVLRVGAYWLDSRRDEKAALARWWARADVPALLLTCGLFALVLDGTGNPTYLPTIDRAAFVAKAAYWSPEATLSIALSSGLLVGMALLPAAVRLLSETDDPAPFLVNQRGKWLVAASLFLLFVVPPIGTTAGIPIPIPTLVGAAVLAVLAAIRFVKLERLEWEIALLNRGRGLLARARTRLLMRHRREIVDRALLIERVQRERSKIRHRGETDGEWAERFVSDRGRLAGLDVAERYLQTGDAPHGARPSRADRAMVRLRFPSSPPLLYPALGCGPGRDWRESGQLAFKYGARLAVLPIAFTFLALLGDDLEQAFNSEFGLDLFLFMAEALREVAFWLVAAYTFGCLFSWLPGMNGALKGLVFSLPVAIAVGTEALFPIFTINSEWVFRSLFLLIFLSAIGLLLDFRTVRDAGLRSRSLGELYRVRSLRFGLVNLVPLAIAAIAIYQGFRAGNPQEAIERAVESASSFPASGGGGGGTGLEGP